MAAWTQTAGAPAQGGLPEEGRRRAVIEHVWPEIDGGEFAIKRVVGQKIAVEADIFTDGHDQLSCRLLYRVIDPRAQPAQEGAAPGGWWETPMEARGNDRWRAEFTAAEMGTYEYTLQAW